MGSRCSRCFEQQASAAAGTNGHANMPQPIAGFKNKISQGGAEMTNAIIEHFKDQTEFKAASARKLEQLKKRDEDDGVKLQAGIDAAIKRKVLPDNVKVEEVIKVKVTGKSPADLAKEIQAKLPPNEACVLTIQGLSGVGKGTVVEQLKGMLTQSVTWSNGNIFRSITLLATKYAIQKKFSEEETSKFAAIIPDLKGDGDLKKEFDQRIKDLLTTQEVLTDENLKMFFSCLDFDKFKNDALDTKIESSELLKEGPLYVKEVEGTVLKTISPFIPAIAEVTQGEVIDFIKKALDKLIKNGDTVLLEGREQTLKYIPTKYRFELVMDDNSVLGMRQAALMMGQEVKKKVDELPDDTAVLKALMEELNKLDK